jgi:hypothetical protein
MRARGIGFPLAPNMPLATKLATKSATKLATKLAAKLSGTLQRFCRRKFGQKTRSAGHRFCDCCGLFSGHRQKSRI